MKKLLVLTTAVLLVAGASFAQDKTSGKKKEETKECCKKDGKEKDCCKKEAKTTEKKTAKPKA
ncbi:MAG: hypothetical protein JSR09_05005 [Bacteroidetes bacterium]|nr:hypothetical protein [Bacteroidota bacterium]MBS1649045.1 hypothetical protein [Bacteroidota bacterium]